MIYTIPDIIGSGELYLSVMKMLCGNTEGKSMLDLMCHRAPYTSQLGFSERTYVDALNRPLDNPEEQQYFVRSDVFEFLKENKRRYDVCICSDGIEHLEKKDGWNLIWYMRNTSEKHIIFTPLGEVMMHIGDDLDSHRSGWTPEDMPHNYISIVFPNFHPVLNCGAWFGVWCDEAEQNRILTEIKSKYE